MKKTRNTPTARDTSIVNGVLYFEDARQCDLDAPLTAAIIGDGYCKAIRVVSLSTAWYKDVYLGGDGFRQEFVNVQMTLRREIRSGRGHWYAYRRVMGKLYKRYVGDDEAIDQRRLLDVAQKLPTL